MKLNVILFVVIIVIYALLNWFNFEYIMTEENITKIYEDIIENDSDKLSDLIESARKTSLITYLISSIFVIIKLLVYAFAIYIYYYLTEKHSFRKLLSAILISESINIIGTITKEINLAFFQNPSSISDLTIMPLSLLSFFNPERLDQWMIMPLNSINVFEALYIIVLSYSLSKCLKKRFRESLKVTIYTYGLLMAFTIILSTFLSIYATK